MGRMGLLSSLVSLLLLTGLFAQDTPVVAKDTQALGIIEQSRAAMGGAAALAYQDSVGTGTVSFSGATTVKWPAVLKSKGETLVRIELQKPKGLAVRILNNGRAVLLEPDGRRRNLVGNNTLAERVNHIPLFSFLAEAEKPDVAVEFLGASHVNGMPTLAVVLSQSSLTSSTAGRGTPRHDPHHLPH